MVHFTSTVAAALLVGSVTATSYRFNPNGKTLAVGFHRKDNHQASPPSRLAKRQDGTSSQTVSWGDLLYYINITIGTPGQNMAAWLDTGSSDLWVPDTGTNICESGSGCADNGGFNPSRSSSYQTVEEDGFSIAYASGDRIVGDYGTDTLRMDGVELKDMQFGVASRGRSSTPLSGIMGIGYTLGESVEQASDLYPNIIDQLVKQNVISTKAYSLYLNDLANGHGTILFGGVDQAKYEGKLGIVNVQKTEKTGVYDTFNVVLTKLSFVAGGENNDLDVNGGLTVVLDSGTTLTYLPDDLALAVYDGLGITFDDTNGPYVACNVDTSNMHFEFTFGAEDGVMIRVDLGQFVRPYDRRMDLPASNGGRSCAFGLYPAGSVTAGQGDVLFGDTFLRSAYVVYDMSNNQVAMAQAKFNVDDEKIVAIEAKSSVPEATTVANQVSTPGAEASDIGAVPTQDFGSGDITDSVPSATFEGMPAGGLQTGTTEPAQPSATSNAASSVRPPPVDWKAVGAVGVAGVAAMLGSGLIFTM